MYDTDAASCVRHNPCYRLQVKDMTMEGRSGEDRH